MNEPIVRLLPIADIQQLSDPIVLTVKSAYFWRTILLSGKERADLVTAHDVYERCFETLGTPALLGRTFQASDYMPNAPRSM